jgi:hypothetical protein
MTHSIVHATTDPGETDCLKAHAHRVRGLGVRVLPQLTLRVP